MAANCGSIIIPAVKKPTIPATSEKIAGEFALLGPGTAWPGWG